MVSEQDQLREAVDRLAESAQDLQMSKCHFEAMLASTAEGMMIVDLNGTITEMNAAAKTLLQVSPCEASVALSHLPVHTGTSMAAILADALATGHAVQRDVQLQGIDDRMVVARLNVAPIKDWSNRPAGVVVIIHDMTKEREEAQRKTEYLSMASHELRAPMTVAREGLNCLLDEIVGEIPVPQRRILHTIRDNVDRLIRLVNDLLDLSKIEAGRMELQKTDTDLVVLLRRIVDEYAERVQAEGLTATLAVPATLMVHVDADKVIQIVTNLISNALKFTEHGGVTITVTNGDDMVACAVADTGMGLAPEDMPKLFGKFAQFAQGQTKEKGTGLGLSIVKQLVEAHGGEIWVTSKKDEGTTFTFTLPKCAAAIGGSCE